MEQNEQIGKKRKIEEIVGNKVKRVKQEGKWGRRGKKRENGEEEEKRGKIRYSLDRLQPYQKKGGGGQPAKYHDQHYNYSTVSFIIHYRYPVYKCTGSRVRFNEMGDRL